MQSIMLEEPKETAGTESVKEQRAQFMQNRCLKDYSVLEKNKGTIINFSYLRNDGYIFKGASKLIEVYPFKGIRYAGGFIPFLDKEKALMTITNEKGELIYDRSYVLNSTSLISDPALFNTYQLNTFGTNKPEELAESLIKIRAVEQVR